MKSKGQEVRVQSMIAVLALNMIINKGIANS
jgi:hypothetical protein